MQLDNGVEAREKQETGTPHISKGSKETHTNYLPVTLLAGTFIIISFLTSGSSEVATGLIRRPCWWHSAHFTCSVCTLQTDFQSVSFELHAYS